MITQKPQALVFKFHALVRLKLADEFNPAMPAGMVFPVQNAIMLFPVVRAEAVRCQEQGEHLDIKAKFGEIYIGHTPTTKLNTDQPMSAFNIHNLDTGSGNSGRLTIMDIDTKGFWQSDLTSDLYKGFVL